MGAPPAGDPRVRGAGLAVDGGRDRPPPGAARAGARGGPRGDRPAGSRAGGPHGRGDPLRPRRGDARRRPRARRGAGADQRRVPSVERRMDRPPGGQRGRGAVPLGLHADGRPRRGAVGDPPRAAPRRTRGTRGVGRGGRQPVGAHAAPGADRAGSRAGAGPRGRPRPIGGTRPRRVGQHTPGPFALGDPERVRELLEQAGFVETRVEAVDVEQRHASYDAFWETMLDISRELHDLVLAQPAQEVEQIRVSLAARLAPYTAADGHSRSPAARWWRRRARKPVGRVVQLAHAPTCEPHMCGVVDRPHVAGPGRAACGPAPGAHAPSRNSPSVLLSGSLPPMLYDDDADLALLTEPGDTRLRLASPFRPARPSRSSATAPRATPTR